MYPLRLAAEYEDDRVVFETREDWDDWLERVEAPENDRSEEKQDVSVVGGRLGEGVAESGEIVPVSWAAIMVDRSVFDYLESDGERLARDSPLSPIGSDGQRRGCSICHGVEER